MTISTDRSHDQKRALDGANSIPQLLIPRRAAALMLGGVSIASLKRLELKGELTPVRLNKRSPVSQVFYRRAQIFALAQVEPEDA
jgi:hypothetical protein